MPKLESSKQRASRIPLNYFKHQNAWERRKFLFSAVAVVAAGAWWTSGALLGHQALMHSPGVVAAVHQTWNNDCEACHTTVQLTSVSSVAVHWRNDKQAIERKCTTCHAAPEHNPLQIQAEVSGCADCHHEHQGAAASLVRVGDRSCVQCHSVIGKHIDPHNASAKGLAQTAQQKPLNVTRFNVDHPPFHSAEQDPGRIKFSHFVHLMPGVHEFGLEDRQPMTLADIADPVQRERYRKPGQSKSDDAKSIVQLDCNSCHQLDSGDYKLAQLSGLPKSSLPPRAAGAYMLPITYENQCQACHTIDLEPGNTATALVHRQTPEQLHRTVEQAFTAKVLLDAPHLLDQYEPPQPLPNQFPPDGMQLRGLVEERVAAAERRLDTAVCGKCHYAVPSDAGGLHAVEPAKIPAVWFASAKFDHHAHRAVDCRTCHARAYRDDPQHSNQASDVLIPKIEVCMKCHAPRDETTAEPHGGARFDCVECHRYHNGAAPLAGPGAQIESPAHKLDLQHFESGQ